MPDQWNQLAALKTRTGMPYNISVTFFLFQWRSVRTLPEEVLAINVLDLGVRNFVRLASTDKVMKFILSLLSERFELRALMEHPWGVLAAQRLGINTSLPCS